MDSKPTVVVLDDWENVLRDRVDWRAIRSRANVIIHNTRLCGHALRAALSSAQVLVVFRDRTPVDADLIALLPGLQRIISTGARNRTLDAKAAEQAGIHVGHTAWGPSKASTCEHTWALILAAVRRVPQSALSASNSRWRNPDVSAFMPPVMEGKRLGLIGLGQIGQRVAAIGKVFGMQVVTWSPNMTAERAAEHGVLAVSLKELLETSLVVSLHLVPSETSRHLLNAERLGWMHAGAILVNTSRAELIDTDALVDALHHKRIAYCALDVFDQEPLAPDHPLLNMPNVLLTPHVGFLCEEVVHNFAVGVQDQLEAHLSQQGVYSPL